MEQLKVPIGADVSGLKKGLSEAEKALKDFAKQSKGIETQLKANAVASSKLGNEITQLTADFKKGAISESNYGRAMLDLTNKEKGLSSQSKILRSDLAKLNSSTKDLGGKGMQTLKKGAISGNSAMTAFSRTVQDAPFGIMGVSNNITNLTEQFGYLKNKTGSAKGALQAMLRDLKGFGGISLAISVATSLLLVFGDTLFKTKDKAKELKEEQEKLATALENYIEGLNALDKATLKANQSAAKETTTLNLLRKAAEDVTLSEEDRTKAVVELQKLYPDYLGNISKEKILNGEVATTYKDLTTNILKRAKATAALNTIIRNSEKVLVLEKQASELKAKTDKKAIELQNAYTLSQLRAGKERAGLNNSVSRAIQLQSEYNDLLKEGVEIETKISKITIDNESLEKAIQSVGGVKGGGKDLAIDVDLDVNAKVTGIEIPIEATPDVVGIDEIIENLGERLDTKGRQLSDIFKKSTTLELSSINTVAFDESAELFKLRLWEFNMAVDDIMSQGVFDTLSGFGEAIGSALASGGNILQAAGNALLGTLGGIMVKYGKLVLAFGLASEALKIAMQNPFGGGIAAVVAGVALIAIGSAISSFASSTSKGASSASTGGSSASSTGSSYTPPVTSSRGSSNGASGGTFVFEIQGTKLIGVIQNTLQRNRNLGGTNLRLT